MHKLIKLYLLLINFSIRNKLRKIVLDAFAVRAGILPLVGKMGTMVNNMYEEYLSLSCIKKYLHSMKLEQVRVNL